MMLSVRQKVMSSLVQLTQLLMKSRREAAIVAMLTAAIPFLGWASLVIVCLVTLRKGMREGLFILSWAVVPAFISSCLIGSWLLGLESVMAYLWLWGVACLLRKTASWAYVLEASALVGVIVILFLHVKIPDLSEIYFNYLMDLYKSSTSDTIAYADMQTFVQHIVNYLLGVQVVLYVIHNLFCLLIARGLQAMLYNPKGLSRDLKMIRLNWASWAFAAICLFFGMKMSSSWALDTFPVWIVLFVFAGLSLVHYLIKVKLSFRGAIPVFYILLMLLFPVSLIPVALLAFTDTGWDMRKKF